MTVICLTKYKNTYTISGDGRTSQDWAGVSTDSSIKVFKTKDCIYGGCGHASARLVINKALSRTSDPFKLLKLLNHKDWRDLLQPTSVLVASKKHGAYTVSIDKRGMLSTGHDVNVITWDDGALPQVIGSGFLQVRTLLSMHDNGKLSPKVVKDAITSAYKTNHTIGGNITQLSISK